MWPLWTDCGNRQEKSNKIPGAPQAVWAFTLACWSHFPPQENPGNLGGKVDALPAPRLQALSGIGGKAHPPCQVTVWVGRKAWPGFF